MQIHIKYDGLPGHSDDPESLFAEVVLNPISTTTAQDYSHLIHDMLRAAWLYAPNMGDVALKLIGLYVESIDSDDEYDSFWFKFHNDRVGAEYKQWVTKSRKTNADSST